MVAELDIHLGVAVLIDMVKEYAVIPCPICLNGLANGDRVMETYCGCDHLHHERCLQQLIHREQSSHLLCGICNGLAWANTTMLDKGISLFPEHVDDILYRGKCIENRNQKWSPGYYWLRTTMKKHKSTRSPEGCIVALVYLDHPIEDQDATSDQLKWFDDEYGHQHPITLIWRHRPIRFTPLPGSMSRFTVSEPTLRRLIRY